MRDQVKTAKVNGWNPGWFHLRYLKPQIVPYIEGFRVLHIKHLNKEQIAGRRYCDNDMIFCRIASALYNSKFEPAQLENDEIAYLINLALSDCASADYWYIYEKEW